MVQQHAAWSLTVTVTAYILRKGEDLRGSTLICHPSASSLITWRTLTSSTPVLLHYLNHQGIKVDWRLEDDTKSGDGECISRSLLTSQRKKASYKYGKSHPAEGCFSFGGRGGLILPVDDCERENDAAAFDRVENELRYLMGSKLDYLETSTTCDESQSMDMEHGRRKAHCALECLCLYYSYRRTYLYLRMLYIL